MATSLPTRRTSEGDLNAFNVYLRSQPWYQDWFRTRGLDPNRVKLSRGQQGELERLMRQNGLDVQGGMHIDAAGNVNQKNRLARNLGIAAGIAAGGYFAAPALAGLGGASAAPGAAAATGAGAASTAGAAIPTLASTTIGSGMAAAAPTIAGASGAAATGGGGAMGFLGTLGRFGKKLIPGLEDIGQWVGQTAEGRAEGRKADIDATALANRQEMDRTALEERLAQNLYANEYEQFAANTQLPNLRASQAVRGDLIANMEDVHADHPRANVVHFSGGLRPSALGPNAREAGRKLSEIGLSNMGNEKMPTIPKTQMGKMLEMPQAGAVDKILGVAGPAASLAGLLAKRVGSGSTSSSSVPTIPSRTFSAYPVDGGSGIAPLDEGGMTPEVATRWGVADDSPIGRVRLPFMRPEDLIMMDGPAQGGITGMMKRPSGAQRFDELLSRVRF
jgi:hypothetical protein